MCEWYTNRNYLAVFPLLRYRFSLELNVCVCIMKTMVKTEKTRIPIRAGHILSYVDPSNIDL